MKRLKSFERNNLVRVTTRRLIHTEKLENEKKTKEKQIKL